MLYRPFRAWRRACRVIVFITFTVPFMASCGGSGGGGGGNALASGGNAGGGNNIGGGGGNTGGGGDWQPGVFLPASTYQARCESPVPGTADVQGTFVDENNFLRSYSNNTYLWYDEIVDRDPALFPTPLYFDLLKTPELTPSGNPKDKFHFSLPTDEWIALSQSGVSVGYGAQYAVVQEEPLRVFIAYTEPGTPAAAASLERGADILAVDGEDVANPTDFDTLIAGLFPETAGESHKFTVRELDGAERTFDMQSAVITSTPVQEVSVIPTPIGDIGYILFNDHIATAEEGLISAVEELSDADVSELVVDIRYNGGGFLDIASEFAYMIAGNVPTDGRPFETIKFNDKHPLINPVTGETLAPVPFHTRSLGFSVPAGTSLPTLDLARVYVLTGPGTCSASESIMNSLLGVGVEVIQIGSTTCGKPYGFYPASNCGTTYFTIQFQGVNALGFGDYADGFSPENTAGNAGTLLPGCSVGDDFGHALGDPDEARLSAALTHSETGSCPAASGLSNPRLSKQSLLPADNMVLRKSFWQENRIMRR